MLIEICAGHSVANVSSKYWVSHLFREGEAVGVEWKLSDQLTEHGMSPHCHLTGAGLSSLKCQSPKSQPTSQVTQLQDAWLRNKTAISLFSFHFKPELYSLNEPKHWSFFLSNIQIFLFLNVWRQSVTDVPPLTPTVSRRRAVKEGGTMCCFSQSLVFPAYTGPFYRLLTCVL